MSGRNRWLTAFAVAIYGFLFAPIVVLILFSFNNSRRTFVWQGFTLDWYPKLFDNADLLDSLRVTMVVAVVAVIASTILGSLLGRGLARLRFRGGGVGCLPLRDGAVEPAGGHRRGDARVRPLVRRPRRHLIQLRGRLDDAADLHLQLDQVRGHAPDQRDLDADRGRRLDRPLHRL